MARPIRSERNELSQRVFLLLRRKQECALEDLIWECTSHTWTEVFQEVDRLSRTGELCLRHNKPGDYTVRLPRAA